MHFRTSSVRCPLDWNNGMRRDEYAARGEHLGTMDVSQRGSESARATSATTRRGWLSATPTCFLIHLPDVPRSTHPPRLGTWVRALIRQSADSQSSQRQLGGCRVVSLPGNEGLHLVRRIFELTQSPQGPRGHGQNSHRAPWTIESWAKSRVLRSFCIRVRHSRRCGTTA